MIALKPKPQPNVQYGGEKDENSEGLFEIPSESKKFDSWKQLEEFLHEKMSKTDLF